MTICFSENFWSKIKRDCTYVHLFTREGVTMCLLLLVMKYVEKNNNWKRNEQAFSWSWVWPFVGITFIIVARVRYSDSDEWQALGERTFIEPPLIFSNAWLLHFMAWEHIAQLPKHWEPGLSRFESIELVLPTNIYNYHSLLLTRVPFFHNHDR